MKFTEEAEAQRRFDDVVSDAQSQPIAIRRQGREVAVLLSMAEYERLRSDTIRGFLELRDQVARDAAAAGLTEKSLSELLDVD